MSLFGTPTNSATLAMNPGFQSTISLDTWFNKPGFSDLTIKLSDGREIHVHKIIVCARNTYFWKLCGPESQFAESKKSVIELKDDDPTALEHVLRYLYGLALPESEKWRFWTNIYVTADKYLIPRLSAVASSKICSIAEACTSIDDIFDIMEVIRTDLRPNATLAKLSATLREKHLRKLLGNQRFRAQLDSRGKDAIWKQIDELTSKVFWADLTEKSYFLCEQHKAGIFQHPVPIPEQRIGIFGNPVPVPVPVPAQGRCYCCALQGGFYNGNGNNPIAGTVWMKPPSQSGS